MFLGWFDDTPKKSVESKIEEAIERYVAKFGEDPNICLVNSANLEPDARLEPSDNAAFKDLEVRAVEYVRPNHFWVGRDESPAPSAQAA